MMKILARARSAARMVRRRRNIQEKNMNRRTVLTTLAIGALGYISRRASAEAPHETLSPAQKQAAQREYDRQQHLRLTGHPAYQGGNSAQDRAVAGRNAAEKAKGGLDARQ
jgi:hypothetical protein